MDDDATQFVTFPHPALNSAAMARPVDEPMRALGMRLLQAAQQVRAYGLAAAHLGSVAPVAVISLGDPDDRDYRVLFNPGIVSSSGAPVSGREGSVSMPGIEIDVERPDAVRIAFDTAEGDRTELDLTGFAARIAQHEIDQVNGIFFLARVSRLKRDTAVKRFAKLGRRMG